MPSKKASCARPLRTMLLLALSGAAAACNAILGIGDLPIQTPDAAPGLDACADAACTDAGADAGGGDSFFEEPAEASTDAGEAEAGPATCQAIDDAGFHDMTSASCWTTFDTTLVDPGAKGFVGVAFDGRYLYFAPNYNGASDGIVTRYDTQATFTSPTSWSTFDTTTLNSAAAGFAGAVYDGRYVYFVPNINAVGGDGAVARFDTTASFTTASSWSIFDTATLSPGAVAFQGAVFDGRFVYFVPFGAGGSNSLVARYDSTATSGFTSPTSWSTFDTTTVNPDAAGFIGGIFDGRYVYFVPHENATSIDGVVVRYDTQFAFTSAGSWSTLDLANVDAKAAGFWGGGFDGRYIYLVPNDNGVAIDGLVARYDTAAQSFTTTSWKTFDTTSVNPEAVGFSCSVYDGRFMYLIPSINMVGTDGVVARYDTAATFTLAASWSTFDTTTVKASAKGYSSGAFDGRYVYLVPFLGSMVARFDARDSNAALPSFYSGSFF